VLFCKPGAHIQESGLFTSSLVDIDLNARQSNTQATAFHALKGVIPASPPALVRQTQQVLGTTVDGLSFDGALNRVMSWGHARESRFVALANVHVVVTASRDPGFAAAVASADMTLPDGAPIAWMLRKLGVVGQSRVCGPDLTWALLARCEMESLPVYFFGSSPETLAKLSEQIEAVFPGLQVRGYDAPPFRPLTAQEDADAIDRINTSGAGLVFVGLGCPKQEYWMQANSATINAVMLGVGAAFDFHAGTVARAPMWMRNCGLEWLHRMASEPRRLAKRYLVTNSLFLVGSAFQLLK